MLVLKKSGIQSDSHHQQGHVGSLTAVRVCLVCRIYIYLSLKKCHFNKNFNKRLQNICVIILKKLILRKVGQVKIN